MIKLGKLEETLDTLSQTEKTIDIELSADDVEKVIFDVKRRINILVEKDGYELKPEDEEKAPPITSVEDFINMFGNK